MISRFIFLRAELLALAFAAGSVWMCPLVSCSPTPPGQMEAAWLLRKFQCALVDAGASGDIRPLLEEMQLAPLASSDDRRWYGSPGNKVGVRCRFVVAVDARPDGRDALSVIWVVIERGHEKHVIRFGVSESGASMEQELTLVGLAMSGAEEVQSQLLSFGRRWTAYCNAAWRTGEGAKLVPPQGRLDRPGGQP